MESPAYHKKIVIESPRFFSQTHLGPGRGLSSTRIHLVVSVTMYHHLKPHLVGGFNPTPLVNILLILMVYING